MSIESLHTGSQFGHIYYGQNGRVVKAMDCKSIGFCTRGIKSNLFRFFNWFTVKWIAICSLNIFIRVQISEKTGNLKSSATNFFESSGKNIITEERITSGAIFWMSNYFTEYFLEDS